MIVAEFITKVKKMKTLKHKMFSRFILAALMIFFASRCGRIASDSNFTLGEGESVSGTLFILSQNAILEEGSTVDGSVIMLCCNLILGGEVTGDVFLLTGNINVNSPADITGDVSVLSGNVSK
jgi:hypothetical protein